VNEGGKISELLLYIQYPRTRYLSFPFSSCLPHIRAYALHFVFIFIFIFELTGERDGSLKTQVS
jgi:hypothetical protein